MGFRDKSPKLQVMKRFVIAIDGYAATGKSSTAKKVADKLGYTFINSGAMYRAVTYYLLQNNIPIEASNPEFQAALEKIHIELLPDSISGDLEVYLNDENVGDGIRSMEVNSKVSEVAAISAVRRRLVILQREIGRRGGVVMDGRDIGTVVFPFADMKFFLTARMDVRVGRRMLQMKESGKSPNEDEVRSNLMHRDHIDTSRADSPLRKAKDAIEIDTSDITFEHQVQKIVELVRMKEREGNGVSA